MKVKKIEDKEFNDQVINSVEELAMFFLRNSDEIENVRFNYKGHDAVINSSIFAIEVLFKNDDGYWTVGFSDSDSF